MNFTILSKEIKRGIGIAEKITGKNLTLPILDNLLIEATSNFLKVSATDLEVGCWRSHAGGIGAGRSDRTLQLPGSDL